MDIPKPGPRVSTTISPEIEEITPDIAREYLNHMAKNRRLSESTVSAYAADMASGLWHENGESVIFNTEGELIDGQHRLAAIVKSEIPQKMLVARGVRGDVMHTIDVGKRRSVSDMLTIHGINNSALAGAIGRIGLIYDTENYTSTATNSISSPQVFAYVEEHIEGIARAANRATQLASHIPVRASVLGGAYYIFFRVDPEATEQFFNAMTHMRTDGDGDPRLALMRRLTTIQGERTRVNQLYALDLFIRAWNTWRAQKTLAMIPLSKTLQWRQAL